jgi:hypothetical protein
VGSQDVEQLKFVFGQPHVASVHASAATLRIDLDVGDAYRIVCCALAVPGDRFGGPRAPQQRAHARHELARAARQFDVRVHAALDQFHAVRPVPARDKGERQRTSASTGAERLGNGRGTAPQASVIQDDEIDAERANPAKVVLRVSADDDAFECQQLKKIRMRRRALDKRDAVRFRRVHGL